jgi:phosphocarrier protein
MRIEKKVVIKNKQGLHGRPAALFVKTAIKNDSQIRVKKGRKKVHGKSIMGIMMLAASCGSSVRITAEGEDAQEAVDELVGLLSNEAVF